MTHARTLQEWDAVALCVDRLAGLGYGRYHHPTGSTPPVPRAIIEIGESKIRIVYRDSEGVAGCLAQSQSTDGSTLTLSVVVPCPAAQTGCKRSEERTDAS